MLKGDILVGIDIGTSVVRTIVSQRKNDEEKPLILGVGEALSSGTSTYRFGEEEE